MASTTATATTTTVRLNDGNLVIAAWWLRPVRFHRFGSIRPVRFLWFGSSIRLTAVTVNRDRFAFSRFGSAASCKGVFKMTVQCGRKYFALGGLAN